MGLWVFGWTAYQILIVGEPSAVLLGGIRLHRDIKFYFPCISLLENQSKQGS